MVKKTKKKQQKTVNKVHISSLHNRSIAWWDGLERTRKINLSLYIYLSRDVTTGIPGVPFFLDY